MVLPCAIVEWVQKWPSLDLRIQTVVFVVANVKLQVVAEPLPDLVLHQIGFLTNVHVLNQKDAMHHEALAKVKSENKDSIVLLIDDVHGRSIAG